MAVSVMVFTRDLRVTDNPALSAAVGGTFDLQYDHVIPLALGGASTTDNLQLLCGQCNRQKSADI